MTLGHSFDTTLLGARQGAESAWAAIYRDLAPAVLGYFRARRAVEPQDLVAEVFLHVVRDLGSFEGGEREFRAWVFTIAHHRLLDDHRRRGSRPVEPAPDEALLAVEPEGHAVEDALARRLGDEEVRRLIGLLSADQQAVLLLRIVGDLTVEQVARVTGKRPGAVKALQRRGLAAIKRELARQGVPL